MTKLEAAKDVIKKYYGSASCGIFDCRNLAGDVMSTVYDENGLTIDVCFNWNYFEVFGLTKKEFNKLVEFYDSLGKGITFVQ